MLIYFPLLKASAVRGGKEIIPCILITSKSNENISRRNTSHFIIPLLSLVLALCVLLFNSHRN
jgi:hypothetical protein